ncbi:MAG: cellulase family glycosylhydrolase [Syntrophothermus sp.]
MRKLLLLILILTSTSAFAQIKINSIRQLTQTPKLYEKAEFEINITGIFINPYDAKEISLDMLMTSPSGRPVSLPCFYISGDSASSNWMARYAPQETGSYTYMFRLSKPQELKVYTNFNDMARSRGVTVNSENASFAVANSSKDGFLHKNDYWTFKFDSGKLFRGIGENVGWEARPHENAKWTYEYLLPSLSKNGANFFRTWMCPWNLPLECKKVYTSRYKNNDGYYNQSGIKRMDEFVDLCDSLGLYVMLAMDSHNVFLGGWKDNDYNVINGGPCKTPTDFFTMETAQSRYKNRLRYLIARWGYSTSIAAWEFFNEIDNSAFTPHDSIIIPHEAITQWHDEMSRYIKDNDPYDHIVTTSISHRDIIGMNSLPHIDLNQKHIYKRTEKIPGIIKMYAPLYNKPYSIGEFGFRWEDDDPKYGDGFDYDYKRGLWYGIFNPTPILPMTWWWELFDTRNMTPYFKGVREISDQMLEAGNGSFEPLEIKTNILESYAVKCGDKIFVYLLNNSGAVVTSDVRLDYSSPSQMSVQGFVPAERIYKNIAKAVSANNGKLTMPSVSVDARKELVLILSPKNSISKSRKGREL